MSTQGSNMDNSLDIFSTSDLFENFQNDSVSDSDYEHLLLIFKDILCTVSFVDVEENVFKDELPKLKNACLEVTNKIQELLKNNENGLIDELKSLLQKYINLLNLGHLAVKYISGKVKFEQVPSLPFNICEIILQSFKHCKNSEAIYGNYFTTLTYLLTELFKKTNELQTGFINLINNLLIFDLRQEFEVETLVKVLDILATIGEIVSSLDIKTTAEVWKAYVLINQTHIESLKSRANIERPIQYFSLAIVQNINDIINMTDWKLIEKNLKLTNFNLKLVIKLCNLYSDNIGDCYEKLFNLLITINKCSKTYLDYQKKNNQFIDSMQVYVTVASEPLLNCIISDRQFVQYFFKNFQKEIKNEENKLAATLLLISVLKKILNVDLETKNQWLLSDESFNLINLSVYTFDYLYMEFALDLKIILPSFGGNPARHSSLYELYLNHVVAVIISLNRNEQFDRVQKLFAQNLLHTNLWKSMFVIDCWCILARYCNVEFCYDQLNYLINIFLQLKDGCRLETKYLSILISRLYQFLTNKYKLELSKQYSYIENLKLWAIIGLANVENSSESIDSIINEAIKNINHFLNGNTDPNHFKSICDLLELIATYSFSTENNTIKNMTASIVKLWMLNSDSSISQTTWFSNFTTSRCKITSCIINYFSNTDLLKILKSLSEVSGLTLENKISSTLILKSLATKKIASNQDQTAIFMIISNLFRALLNDSNPFVKQHALESFSHFAHNTAHKNILANVVERDRELPETISNYLQKKITPNDNIIDDNRKQYLIAQSKVKLQHKCIVGNCLEPAQKKKKLSDDKRDIIVQRLKSDTDLLAELCKTETLSHYLSTDLSNVITRLQSLL